MGRARVRAAGTQGQAEANRTMAKQAKAKSPRSLPRCGEAWKVVVGKMIRYCYSDPPFS